MHALDLPEMEAPHLGVSSGGVEVEGTVLVRACLTGNGSPSSGRQLGRGGSGREGVEVEGSVLDKKYQPSTAQAHLILPTVEHQNIVGPNLDDVRPSPMRIGHRPISFEIE